MAKLTKFKAQQVEFPTHYKVEDTNRGDTKIKNIIPAFGTIRENGTPETEEIYNGLQLGSVHTLQANKTTNLNIDYYVCNLDGLTEFGLNNDLKLRVNVDSENTNTTTKLRLNNVDYTLLKEHNGTLKQIEAGDFKPNKSYELVFNGSQFVVINIMEYGTTADTALEGNRLAEIIGIEFGGNIQDTGNKVKGKFYFDSVTKFYYECIENTNLTYNDATKFRAISNKPISDKLENLFSSENTYFKIGTMIIQCGRNEIPNGSGEEGTRFRFPKPFKNSCLAITANDVGGGARSVAVSPASTSEFKAWARFGKDFSGSIFYWIAIGF
ncbi:gp53-like domain-containing protein [Leptotrichia trevisanii]|uniref:gp53-like domain-containing protein n=1 Tax=Leptotrichia trevisanii TaxID=109328 RepID=UPI0003F768F3|nr:hypothetical protein [Leptotrichia trevisanii]